MPLYLGWIFSSRCVKQDVYNLSPWNPHCYFPLADCSAPYRSLGMQNGKILDSQITASSQIINFEAFKARLYGSSCWRSARNNSGEFLEVKLGQKEYVKAITTQGDPREDNWTTQFYVAFSLGSFWKNITWSYHGVKVCHSNTIYCWIPASREQIMHVTKTNGVE